MEQKKNSANTSALERVGTTAIKTTMTSSSSSSRLKLIGLKNSLSQFSNHRCAAGTVPPLAAGMTALLTVPTPVDLEFDHQPAADALPPSGRGKRCYRRSAQSKDGWNGA
jgi:hypothetical protein